MEPNNSKNYSKSFAIKSIMGNPKLSKVLFDAWAAPVGSTKTAHAKSIMKSIERSADGYIADGKGGPGLQGAPFNNPFNRPEAFLQGAPQPQTQPPRLPQPTSPTPTNLEQDQATGLHPLAFSGSYNPISTGLSQDEVTGKPKGSVFLKTVDDLTPRGSTPKDSTTGSAPLDDLTGDLSGDEEPKAPSFNYQNVLSSFGVDTKLPDVPERFSSIAEAVDTGVGEKTFSTQAFADKGTLSKLLGVPEETLEWLPEGGFLNDYIEDLKEETKNRYNIDAQLQKVRDLESTGLTVESDLQSYIRGKDQYLGQIETLYNNSRDKMATMDLSDPRDAKRMNNYLNYLTILKGRQNQRYMDYVNTSVKMHDAKIQRATNLYNQTREDFNEDFAALKAGATEKYGALKDIVSEMYTNISDREEDMYRNNKRKLDLINSAVQLSDDIFKNEEESNEEVTSTKEYNTLVEQQKDELESGRPWGEAWASVKRRYPNVSDDDIDNALGGGITTTEEEAKAKDPDNQPVQVGSGWAWGWATPGAFQTRKSTLKTNKPSKSNTISMVNTLLSTESSVDLGDGVTGWKGLSNAEICQNFNDVGITALEVDKANNTFGVWANTCKAFITKPEVE